MFELNLILHLIHFTETFEGFDTTVLELKTVFSMTATAGRTRHISCFAVTGNGAGLAGFGLGKGNTGMAAIKQCKRRAGQRLIYVERCDGHTGERGRRTGERNGHTSNGWNTGTVRDGVMTSG